MSLYRDQLEAWIKTLDIKAESVLDVGGGEKPIPNRVNSWDVKSYKILDTDLKYNPDVVADLNFPFNWTDKTMHAFDVVFCLEVMEYIWNPVLAHQNLNRYLKKGGKLYISYPTLYPLHGPEGIDYLRYSRNAIHKLLEQSKFKVVNIVERPATTGGPALEQFFHAEGHHALKGNRDVYNVGYLVEAEAI